MHQSLIQFALRHYQFPVHYERLIHTFYNHLLALVDMPEVFQTQPFHLAIGVFQGCTLSQLLFNLVVQLLLDSLEQKKNALDIRGLNINKKIILTKVLFPLRPMLMTCNC